jgi:hypothetical protein
MCIRVAAGAVLIPTTPLARLTAAVTPRTLPCVDHCKKALITYTDTRRLADQRRIVVAD